MSLERGNFCGGSAMPAVLGRQCEGVWSQKGHRKRSRAAEWDVAVSQVAWGIPALCVFPVTVAGAQQNI